MILLWFNSYVLNYMNILQGREELSLAMFFFREYALQVIVVSFVKELVRQSQILQSVMQDCKYVLSHLLPV